MSDTGTATPGGPGPVTGNTTAPGTAASTGTTTAPGTTTATGTPALPAVRRRGRGVSGTVADMTRSLGVLVACVVVVWLVSGVWHASTRSTAGIADWRSQVTDVAPTAGFALQAPVTLPAGWAVSAVRLSGTGSSGEWTMTVTTPTGHYLDLDQATGGIATRVGAVLPQAVPDGQVVLTGGTWSRFALSADAQGRAQIALAREVSTTAVIVSGTGTLAEQSLFADALRATR